MTISQIAQAIQDELEAFSDPSRQQKIATDHPTSMRVLGLKVADMRLVIDDWRKKREAFSEDQWIALCLELVGLGILECQIVAYEFLWKNKKALQALSLDQILALGKNLDNWASVDIYCTCITGYCWRIGTLEDQTIELWARSQNPWLRRTALVSTVPLNLKARGGTGDARRTILICQMLVDDKHDMVVKALSWALRELSKSDRKAVVAFMDQHADRIHSRVKREVETKLRTGKKNGDAKQINSTIFAPANQDLICL